MTDGERSDLGIWRGRLTGHLGVHGAGDIAHDMGHLVRVSLLAGRIASEEGMHDPLILMAACMLHDCVPVPKNSPLRSQASRMAADLAEDLLGAMGFPAEKLPGVRHAIEAHSYSAGIEPLTPEARALQDADRVEALGAIGIARCFAVSGSMGRPLFDGEDPLAERRPLDEQAWALDHFQTKLLKLPDTMRTAAGRRVASERAEYLRDFMRRVAEECAA